MTTRREGGYETTMFMRELNANNKKKSLVNVVCECDSEAGTEDETFNKKFFPLITDSCWDVIFAEVLQFLFLSTSIFSLSSLHLSCLRLSCLHLSMGPVSEQSLWCWWWTCSASESILLFLCESTCWSHSLLLLFPIHSLCFLDLISSLTRRSTSHCCLRRELNRKWYMRSPEKRVEFIQLHRHFLGFLLLPHLLSSSRDDDWRHEKIVSPQDSLSLSSYSWIPCCVTPSFLSS